MCEVEYINIQSGGKVNLSFLNSLKDNSLLKNRPEIWVEWDFKKNDELGLDIYKVTKGSQKKAFWICERCNSSYETNFNNKYNNNNCPYCSGKKVNHTNSLATLNPELSNQWNVIKNGNLTPLDVTANSNKKVWWQCELCHEWEATINSKSDKSGCPYCSGLKVLKGFNDMWTTNPELASLLAEPEDGYKHMQYSHKKVDWKCPECDEIVKNKEIRSVNVNGISCEYCSSGKSYSEKIIRELLKELNINFKCETKFDWSKNKRYDFFFSHKNEHFLIESNGSQHSIDRGFERVGGRTIEEEQANDQLKEKLAKDNGIEHYIVIDARYSDFEYIKENLINSQLSDIFDLVNVNWKKINQLSESSLVRQVCELWMRNNNIKAISKESNLDRNTIARYLKRGSLLNWCDYEPKKGYESTKKKVVSISTLDGTVTLYSSITEASKSDENLDRTTISKVCKGIYKYHKNHKWMFLSDFEDKYGKLS